MITSNGWDFPGQSAELQAERSREQSVAVERQRAHKSVERER